MKQETRNTIQVLATEMRLEGEEEVTKKSLIGFAKRLDDLLEGEIILDGWQTAERVAGVEPKRPTFPLSFEDWELGWTSGARRPTPPNGDKGWSLIAVSGDMQCLWAREKTEKKK